MVDRIVDLENNRLKYIEYIRKQLIGPANEEDEELPYKDPPHERYLMGALFPQKSQNYSNDDNEDLASTGTSSPDENPISFAYQLKPSSIGLTFYTNSSTLKISVSAAIYKINAPEPKKEKTWKREVLSPLDNPEVVRINQETPIASVLRDNAKIHSSWFISYLS